MNNLNNIILLAMEWGYNAHEKGMNLEHAKIMIIEEIEKNKKNFFKIIE